MSPASYFATAGAIRLVEVLGHFLWQGTLIAVVAVCLGRLFTHAPVARRWVFRTALILLLLSPPLTAVYLGSILPADWDLHQKLLTAGTSGRAGLVSRWFSRFDAEHLAGVSQPFSEGLVASYLHAPSAVLGQGWTVAAPLGAALYLLLVLLVSTKAYRDMRVLPAMTEGWTGCYDPGFLQALQRKSRQIGLRHVPPVACSEMVDRPILLGCWRPMVVLPRSWVDEKPVDALMACLDLPLRELRMHATGWLFFESLARIGLFFHPAVWWMLRHKHQTRRPGTGSPRHPSLQDRAEEIPRAPFPATAMAQHTTEARRGKRPAPSPAKPTPVMPACHARHPNPRPGSAAGRSREVIPRLACSFHSADLAEEEPLPDLRFLRMPGFSVVPLAALLCLGFVLEFARVPEDQPLHLVRLRTAFEGSAQVNLMHEAYVIAGTDQFPVVCVADSCVLVEDQEMLTARVCVRAYQQVAGEWELALVLEDEANTPLATGTATISTTANDGLLGYARGSLETATVRLPLGETALLHNANHFHLSWQPLT